jgi:hypothetical protein
MQVTCSSVLSATAMPGIAPCRATIACQAWRRAACTAELIRTSGRLPPAISLSPRQQVGTRRDQPEQPALISRHPEIADHLGAVGDHSRQVRDHPAPVMDQQPAWGRRSGQAHRQPCPVGQPPQQHQARMRHDALATGCDLQPSITR